jgi:hypothetical protein
VRAPRKGWLRIDAQIGPMARQSSLVKAIPGL